MYAVLKDGEIVGLAEVPNYIKEKDGILVNCSAKEATAISIKGTVYQDAIAKEIDGGEHIFGEEITFTEDIETNKEGITDNADVASELYDAIIELSDAIAELTESEV